MPAVPLKSDIVVVLCDTRDDYWNSIRDSTRPLLGTSELHPCLVTSFSLPLFLSTDEHIDRGMIAGNAISGMAVATTYVVRELVDNRDKVETYLAHGASRTEAVLPVAREALLLA